MNSPRSPNHHLTMGPRESSAASLPPLLSAETTNPSLTDESLDATDQLQPLLAPPPPSIPSSLRNVVAILATDPKTSGYDDATAVGGGHQHHKFNEYVASQKTVQVIIDGDEGGVLFLPVVHRIQAALDFRRTFVTPTSPLSVGRFSRKDAIEFVSGVAHLPSLGTNHGGQELPLLPAFHFALSQLNHTVESVECIKCAEQRLSIIEQRSKTTFLLNAEKEAEQQYYKIGGVCASVKRVDNSVNLHRCAVAHGVIEFYAEMYEHRPQELAGKGADGSNVTVRELTVEDPSMFTPERLGWQRTTSTSRSSRLAVANQLGHAMELAALHPEGRLFPLHFARHLGLDRLSGTGGNDGGSGGVTNRGGQGSAGMAGSLSPPGTQSITAANSPGGAVGSGSSGGGLGGHHGNYGATTFFEMRVPVFGLAATELPILAKSLKDFSFQRGGVMYFLQVGLRDMVHQWWQQVMEGGGGGGGGGNNSGSDVNAALMAGVGGDRGGGEPPKIDEVMAHLFKPLFQVTLLDPTVVANDPHLNSVSHWAASLGGVHLESTRSSTTVKDVRAAWVAANAAAAQQNSNGATATTPAVAMAPPRSKKRAATLNTNVLRKGLLEGLRSNDNFTMPPKPTESTTILDIDEETFEFLVWANIRYLNRLRHAKGMSTLQFRRGVSGVSAAQSSGSSSPFLSGYLLADVITSAAGLCRLPVLQYLCGLSHIDVTVSPLADNGRGDFPYASCPLKALLYRGLRVALATEEPLYFHHNPDPLLEEYGTAQKLCRLEALDMTEIARNSVIMSAFPPHIKASWLGVPASDIATSVNEEATHVTGMRVKLRAECWSDEHRIIGTLVGRSGSGLMRRFDKRMAAKIASALERQMSFGDVASKQLSSDSEGDDELLSRQAQPQSVSRRTAAATLDSGGGSLAGATGGSANSAGGVGGEGKGAGSGGAARAGCRWNPLTSVKDFENFSHVDSRISFPRVVVAVGAAHRPKMNRSSVNAARRIAHALHLRQKYIWEKPRPWRQREATHLEEAFKKRTANFDEDQWTYEAKDAVFIAFKRHEVRAWPKHLPTLEEFHQDLIEIKHISDSVDVKDFAHERLEALEHRFYLHLALNHANEAGSSNGAEAPTRDFYHCAKVDTHVHMAAGMTARQMKDFIVSKLQHNPDDIVAAASGQVQTMASMAKRMKVTTNLTVDQLNVQADHTLFERFDNFNSKYNPMGQGDLRTMLLKTENFMNGRYFAELTNLTFAQFSKDRYTFAENRLSVYGISLNEWGKLADWFDTHGMSSKHNKWMVQLPRVYNVFRRNNTFGSFGQYLSNVFKPLWEVSLHPANHPRLHNFLTHVSGFDSVDDESAIDAPFAATTPWQWTVADQPPYNYYMYHLWANIRSLNEFRVRRGLSHFDFRPHCGESGSDEHLVGCFLTADAINHGINLRNDPSLQYLYYLAQIGLAVSPLSNNALFLFYLNNPFADFFRRGLNVSLSTDDPLMFHQTTEPLIEEYSIAANVWGFSPNDLC